MLAGASGGGTWAIWCALDRPERVRGLVMLGSVPLLPGARIPIGIRLMATPVLGDVLSRTVRPGRRMLLRLMSSVGEGDTILRHPDLLDSLIDAAHDPVATAANVAEFQALISPFGTRSATRIRPDDLRRLAVPTLMIWGDHDPVVSVADARAAAELIPDARLEVLPAGHVPQLGNPDAGGGATGAVRSIVLIITTNAGRERAFAQTRHLAQRPQGRQAILIVITRLVRVD